MSKKLIIVSLYLSKRLHGVPSQKSIIVSVDRNVRVVESRKLS
jgi:hypothetical protein